MPPPNRPRRRARVSLTPLIDVVFILLVFFMLASNFLDWRAIRLSGAGAGAAPPGLQGALLVDVRPAGLRLSGAEVTAPELSRRIAATLAERPDLRVIVRPGAGVDVQRAAQVLDALRAAGARDLTLSAGGA
jgi:biopolymer transport protein ExbD